MAPPPEPRDPRVEKALVVLIERGLHQRPEFQGWTEQQILSFTRTFLTAFFQGSQQIASETTQNVDSETTE